MTKMRVQAINPQQFNHKRTDNILKDRAPKSHNNHPHCHNIRKMSVINNLTPKALLINNSKIFCLSTRKINDKYKRKPSVIWAWLAPFINRNKSHGDNSEIIPEPKPPFPTWLILRINKRFPSTDSPKFWRSIILPLTTLLTMSRYARIS